MFQRFSSRCFTILYSLSFCIYFGFFSSHLIWRSSSKNLFLVGFCEPFEPFEFLFDGFLDPFLSSSDFLFTTSSSSLSLDANIFKTALSSIWSLFSQKSLMTWMWLEFKWSVWSASFWLPDFSLNLMDFPYYESIGDKSRKIIFPLFYLEVILLFWDFNFLPFDKRFIDFLLFRFEVIGEGRMFLKG